MKDKTRIQVMGIVAIIVITANIIGGIAGIINSQNYYFICLSFWVIGVFSVTICHGSAAVGWKNVAIMCAIGTLYSLFFEAMGINFGLFFSKYVYTDAIPGPKLFGFNVYSMVAYGLGLYGVYAAGQATVGQFDNRFRRGDVVTVPITATFYTVAIDLATDPLMATIDGSYIWEDWGVYYGIPFQNYIGWYIMAYAMYQTFALVLYFQSRHGTLKPQPEIARKKSFWVLPVILYAANFIQMPFYIFNGENREVINGAGQSFWTNDIYRGVTLVYSLALLAPAFMAAVRILRSKELEPCRPANEEM